MDDKKKLANAEFMLRNYKVENFDDASELLDHLWWIICEGKVKPQSEKGE